MNIEIELKAWSDEPERSRARIEQIAGKGHPFNKNDTYWRFPAGREPPSWGLGSGVRIRREEQGVGEAEPTSRVCFKVKEKRDGIEVNDEREFAISDGETFEELLRRMGLERDISKRKQGWAWVHGGITLELAEIEGLGWFAELEIIADNDRMETIQAARGRLLALLGKIGLGEDKIESRYYTEMLKEGRGRSG
jgi:adenylate cyclase class 2